LRLSIHFKKLQALKLRQKVDPYDWKDFKNVAIVNAHYDRTYNRMKYPAGILQGGFFNSKLPRYMNFGGIGMVIGHEITHGFDDKGRQRNSEGT
jgi:predicted metalloendopeptidase